MRKMTMILMALALAKTLAAQNPVLSHYDTQSVDEYTAIQDIFRESYYWLADPVYFPITSTFDYFHKGAPPVPDAYGPGNDLDLGPITILVSKIAGRVAGFICYSKRPSRNELIMTALPEPVTGYIALLAVKQGYQGYGLGQQLMRAALDDLSTMGVQRVYLYTRPLEVGNARTIRFYEQCGFYLDGDWYPDDHPHDPVYGWLKYSYDFERSACRHER